MFFYKIALLSNPIEPLTYQSEKSFKTGIIVKIPLQAKIVEGFVLEETQEPGFPCQNILEKTNLFFDEKYIKIIKFISNYYICSIGEAAAIFTPFLEQSNDIQFANKFLPNQNQPTLSPLQQQAYEFIKKHQISLLFGDTASGKTEIFFELFKENIQNNKTSIFLLPEISLTPQMEKRLKNVFGSIVAIWHSKVSPKRKKEILEGIASEKIKIVAGARSALFLPLKNIGAIIVDEEHDDSYKSSSKPRLNAKDIAIYMGKILDAKVLLSSATPSLTSYAKFPHFRMRGGFYESKRKFIFTKEDEELSPLVIQELKNALDNKKQAIVFLPTRANFKYVVCRNCGTFVDCPYCSIPMSLHKNHNALKCHYCGFAQKIPQFCHKCNGELETKRVGTSEISHKIGEIFKDAIVSKFDRDLITTEGKLKKILNDFNDKKIDILVGTQMLSKGHDYHDVDLAIILGIDAIMAGTDFRAAERALSLMLQIAGRSGRRSESKVIVQTKNIDFFTRFMDNYEDFLKYEIANRGTLYPPNAKLLKITLTDKSKENGYKRAKKLADFIEENIETTIKEVEFVGWCECLIEKIASKYRYCFLLRSTEGALALLKIAKILPKDRSIEIDMDPLMFS